MGRAECEIPLLPGGRRLGERRHQQHDLDIDVGHVVVFAARIGLGLIQAIEGVGGNAHPVLSGLDLGRQLDQRRVLP
jgi:hypothetical protein